MPNTINFCKMHGLGNDFVIIKTLTPFKKPFIQRIANRHTGIGCDQVILILPSTEADFVCQIFNSDGSQAEQCGNGMRCVARFVHESGLINKNSLTLETLAGIIPVTIHDYENIQVNMGVPSLEHKAIALSVCSEELSVLSMGNPHAIMRVPSVTNCAVATLGLAIGTDSFFPQGVNVGFMEIVNRQHIRLRTFERAAGETLACGSNASAAVVSGIWNNWLDHKVQVELALGSLWVEWEGDNKPVMMTGSADWVFDGMLRT